MTAPAIAPTSDALIAAMLRQYQVEQFYFDEAALLDAHDYDQWIDLFAEDCYYFMPIRRTKMQRDLDQEFTKPGEMAYYDDTKEQLALRVAKLDTGKSWAEDPPSRTRHMITNVRIVEDDGHELQVESNFHLYRTRLKSEEDSWIGRRKDTLRRNGESFQIVRRTVLLDQTLILSRNLSNFF